MPDTSKSTVHRRKIRDANLQLTLPHCSIYQPGRALTVHAAKKGTGNFKPTAVDLEHTIDDASETRTAQSDTTSSASSPAVALRIYQAPIPTHTTRTAI